MTPAATPLATPLDRGLFPVTQHHVYLNHAAVAPLATPARAAMERHLAEVTEHGARGWRGWLAAIETVRAQAAALVGATADEIALTKNTSEGLAAIAQGIDWRPGDRVVGFECEFPANIYPWLALRRRGVVVELLPESALLNLEQVRKACASTGADGRGARLLAVSLVQYLSGLRADVDALGAICRETGTWLVVDGIQGLGAVPLDVKRAGIHACAADGHKWLTGPEGAGFLFVDAALLDQLTPAEVGWFSVDQWEDFAAARRVAESGQPPPWRAGAARFECGSLNTCGVIGLGAAMGVLAGAGIDQITGHLLTLGDRLAAGLREQGCELLRPSEAPQRRSGITSFRHPRSAADAVVAHLEARDILCSSRNGWVRCSPHGYNTADEIDALLAAVHQLSQ
jgi:selenocysteine lyase/cysteine desulfurase